MRLIRKYLCIFTIAYEIISTSFAYSVDPAVLTQNFSVQLIADIESQKASGQEINRFVEAFKSASPASNIQIKKINNIAGRVVRGKTSTDFKTLSNDPNRLVVMLLDADGLNEMIGRSGYEILKMLGYSQTDIEKYVVDEGLQFKLIITEPNNHILLATWDNIPEIVFQAYRDSRGDAYARDLSQKVSQALPFLKKEPLGDLEAVAGYKFSSIQESDPRYMTVERYMASKGSAVDTRAFLFHTLQLRDEYIGNGYTTGGVKEYFAANIPLVSLGNYEIIDLNIRLPSQKN